MYYAFTDDRTHKTRLLDVSSSAAPEGPLEGNCSDALKLSFDPHSEFLACADKSDVVAWFTKDRIKHSTIKLPPDYTIRDVAVSLEGRYIATTSTDGQVRLWDTRGNTDAAIPFYDARSASFSLDGKWLSIGSRSEIKLWNLSAKEFDPRRIPVGGFAIKFSPDDSLLATQEDQSGNKISVWKWDVREPLLEGTVIQHYGDFAFTSDNHLLIAGYSHVFGDPFDAFWALGHVCDIVHRNLTPAERDKYLPLGFDYKPTCRV